MGEPETTAFADHESTSIGSRLARLAEEHPGKSGFSIVRYGQPALAVRLALADLAEHSLDVQYYLWEADPTGRILAERLARAAERGVRVRVLVDDINIAGRDAQFAALAAHPKVDIRIFNPFLNRRLRVLDSVTDLARVNHRMHNKMMIMDNAVSLVGGRNVSAHYFQAAADSNFRDLDIVGAGPIVRDTSQVFDRFWNGPWSVPADKVAGWSMTVEDYDAAIAEIRRRVRADDYELPLDTATRELEGRLEQIFAGLIWAPGEVIWDDPSSVYDGWKPGRLTAALANRLDTVDQELLIESAYFIPRPKGIETVQALRDRGVKVRVLTNSLAANDVLAAHAGYAKYRRALAGAGVELYELRPYPGPVLKGAAPGGSKAALHTKALVFDRQDVFIGSLNMDPRSAAINTEAGIYVQSARFAAQVIEYMVEGVAPENAFRVLLDHDGRLRWVIEKDGVRLDYRRDPNSSWAQRRLAGFLGLLPLDRHL